MTVKTLSLKHMRAGQRGTIYRVLADTSLRKQCEALGLAPGNEIQLLRQTRGKGPLQVKSQGSFFAIRTEEAELIQVQVQVQIAEAESL